MGWKTISEAKVINFQEAIHRLHPEIEEIEEAMRRHPAGKAGIESVALPETQVQLVEHLLNGKHSWSVDHDHNTCGNLAECHAEAHANGPSGESTDDQHHHYILGE